MRIAGNKKLFILLAVILLAGFLRFYKIGSESFWMDEYMTYHPAVNLSFSEMIPERLSVAHYPLYFTLMRAWNWLFDFTEFSARSFSAIFGILTVLFTYLVGKRFFEEKVALLAAFFVAISPISIEYSQEARMYTLVSFLALLNLFFYYGFEKSGFKENKFWMFLFLLVGLYTHAYFSFFVFVLGLWALFRAWKNKKTKEVLLVFLPAIVLSLPLFWGVISGMMDPQGKFPIFTWENVPLKILLTTAFENILFRDSHAVYLAASNNYSYILNAVFLIFFFFSFFSMQRIKDREGRTLKFFFFLFLVPFLIPVLVSVFWTKIFSIHYLLYIIPIIWIFISWGLVNFPFYKFKIDKGTFIGIFLILVSVFAFLNLNLYYKKVHKGPWRGVAEVLKDGYRQGDVVIMLNEYGTLYPILPDYYLKKEMPVYADDQIDPKSVSGSIWLVFIDGFQLNRKMTDDFILQEDFYIDGMRVLKIKNKDNEIINSDTNI